MDWDQAFEEQAAANRKASLEAQARIAARPPRESNHDKGVRLGWWDADGVPLHDPDEDDEGED